MALINKHLVQNAPFLSYKSFFEKKNIVTMSLKMSYIIKTVKDRKMWYLISHGIAYLAISKLS